MFSLKGKVAVITGGASGFGKATALRFARAGAKVVLADINDASNVAKETRGIYVKTDVSKEDQVKNLMERAVSEFGKLDIVVNNAGEEGEGGLIQDIREEALDKVLNVNLKGVVWGIKHAVPRISDGGSIMNTASYAGLFGTPMYGDYVISKAAIISITKTAALELAPRGVRVNCICPGTCDTPMAYIEGGEIELKLASMLQPLGRLGKTEEVAALFHFLASDESAFITGLAIPIDGGMSAGPSLGVIQPLYEMVSSQKLNLSDFTS
ncbi:MAG: SDR family oxidoreductase [Deltaproteobacteria bacterium]|nr:SDR family oxidoreductase [Deltaproteobacteria bacterium]